MSILFYRTYAVWTIIYFFFFRRWHFFPFLFSHLIRRINKSCSHFFFRLNFHIPNGSRSRCAMDVDDVFVFIAIIYCYLFVCLLACLFVTLQFIYFFLVQFAFMVSDILSLFPLLSFDWLMCFFVVFLFSIFTANLFFRSLSRNIVSNCSFYLTQNGRR